MTTAVFDESPAWRAKCAEMFGNRLRKNAKHLRRWASREGLTCYRLYDQDIPEVPVAVDAYADALVLHDYRMHDETGKRRGGDDWLTQMAETACAVLAVSADAMFVKSRERLDHKEHAGQYGRFGHGAQTRVVTEGGLQFVVNLSDYVDTGLFLDHRMTRARVAREPAQRQPVRMLNLFCYTGSFSVYAAHAGMQTTSVDLSYTYIDWARENFAANRIAQTGHQFVQDDVREFLRHALRQGWRYDLAVVDPPTFSNSKRMDYTWDVQRDHAALLADVAQVMAPKGVLWFSTNRRRFRLEPGELAQYAQIADETEATIPPDFRDRKVHRAFRIAFTE